MRYLPLIILCLFNGLFVLGQNKALLFGFEEIPQSLLVNPASNVPQDFHVGIPLASHISVHGGSSGVSVYDIFQESDSNINDRIRSAIFRMSENDFFTVNEQIELLNFGWRKPQSEVYYSGGIYQELDVMAYFPKDLAILAWDGNRDYIGQSFDLGELSVTAEALMVYHFGISKQVKKNLRLGIRAKLYSNIAHASSTGNTGTFTTLIGDGQTNIYEHIIANADIQVKTSGISAISNSDNSTKTAIKRGFLGGNLGLGVDLGLSYDFDRNWTLDASILDLGAVFHMGSIERYRSRGSYTLNGIELLFPALSEGEEAIDYYNDATDRFDEAIPRDTITSGYVQFRPTRINGSLSYGFGQFGEGEACNCLDKGATTYRERVGLQLFSIMRPKRPQFALTAFYYRRLAGFLSAKIAYTWDEYSVSNLGFGLNADFSWVNLYIMTDNILKYGNIAKANNVSLQLGLNIKIDKE